MRQFELVERVVAYDPAADEDLLNRAYVYALQQHGAQKRASGDPYFSHPLEVAGILTEMRLDAASIVTALLHDVVEDTDATLEDIDRMFGAEIMRLVDGVTKLSRLELQSDASKHGENLRKLVLAMSEDIRVLLVKLADRLHNMRTLHFVPKPDKRKRIAAETLEIYAPLADRIGMQQIKDELEDWSFRELEPDARDSIQNRLAFLRTADGAIVDRIVSQLNKELADNGVNAEVYGREKSPYSIWTKMRRKSVSFEQLSDIIAFRVVVDDVSDCYGALGVIHAAYQTVPGRFKDYISTPKPNGYQSIHTCVIGPERQRIELQIRTQRMHDQAEYGVAAHWSYKRGAASAPTEGPQYRWLRELLEVMEHAGTPEEFLEHTKIAMFADQVFCFTPRGDVYALPRGACPVDFAYAVHSEVGDTCVGAKVNGRIMPLRTPLENGDQVEVLTSRAQTPSPTWDRFVVTAKARARIRRFVRLRQREEFAALGRSILQKTFSQEGYTLSDKALDGVLAVFRVPTIDDLLAQVGQGTHGARDVFNAVYPGHKAPPKTGKVVPIGRARKAGASKPSEKTAKVAINGLIPGMAVHYAGCCHPLPGDRIVGIVSTGKGVTIHTIDCDTLAQFADEPQRWLDLSWGDNRGDEPFVGRLHAIIDNTPGSLGDICTLIGKQSGNISNMKFVHRSADLFEVLVDIEVEDLKHLANIMAALRASPSVSAVDRARG